MDKIFYLISESVDWIINHPGQTLAVVGMSQHRLNLLARDFSDYLQDTNHYPSLDPLKLGPWTFHSGAKMIWINAGASNRLSQLQGVEIGAAFLDADAPWDVWDFVYSRIRSPQTIYPPNNCTLPGDAKDWSQVEYKKVGGPSINTKRDNVKFLTEEEHKLIDMLADCQHVFALEVVADEENYESDVGHFEEKINELQTIVLSQAAARAYPDKYRLLGRAEFNEES